MRVDFAARRLGLDFEVSSDHYSPWLTSAIIPCGPDLDELADAVLEYAAAGFTDVALVQVGDENQQRFLDEGAAPLLEKLRG
jgi:hypothetical protein